ncbi:MAG TPA: DUF3131 domain-containing protein [Longimicrobium sp.]
MLKRFLPAFALVFAMADCLDSQRTPAALGDRVLYESAARTAYAYVEANYNAQTGWINSVEAYNFATVWDIGSGLMALFCADQLELLDGDEYDRRMRRALQSLIDARLFEGAAFNKSYSTTTGQIAGRAGQEAQTSERGYGWSVIDIGRLLNVLRVIDANQPQYRDLMTQIVGRLDYTRLIRDGYLRGEDLDSRGRLRRYQEGRVGYEQYAANGFALWGRQAPLALNVRQNTREVTVLGIPLLRDVRPEYHLTSEPFVMMGLETGWTGEIRDLAWRVLAAQEARWRQTGTVTIVSEDALTGPPYFLYYSVHADGREFLVEPPAGAPNGPRPRTVSTKAAFGWHALLPSEYTWSGVQRVEGARAAGGWGAGVFEESGRVSGAPNVNTTAIVLEAALYYARGGRPLIEPPAGAPQAPAAQPAAAPPAPAAAEPAATTP